jgi:hypothetical protein
MGDTSEPSKAVADRYVDVKHEADGYWYVEVDGKRLDRRTSQNLATASASLQIDSFLQNGHDVVYTIYKQDGRLRKVEYYYHNEPIVTGGEPKPWD